MQMKLLFNSLLFVLCFSAAPAQVVHMVFTSDLHYGITRPHFRGQDSVASSVVNSAQAAAINSLYKAGIKSVEAVIVTGDLANREEAGIQTAAVSWKQFLHDYQAGIKTKTAGGAPTSLLVTPGNHDASNAVGHPKITVRDVSSMTGMLKMMEGRETDTALYNYHTHKVNYARNIKGIHLMFVHIWPDSANRLWMEKDLAAVNKNTPVLLFTHDPPQGDAKHFTHPGDGYVTSGNDTFENLLEEVYKDTIPKSTSIEQEGLIALLKRHPNIKAWFHGHENFCEMYDYTGLWHELSLPVFRSDSPLKGKISRDDETQLSFQVISIDAARRTMVVRECFWNTHRHAGNLSWGAIRTIRL